VFGILNVVGRPRRKKVRAARGAIGRDDQDKKLSFQPRRLPRPGEGVKVFASKESKPLEEKEEKKI